MLKVGDIVEIKRDWLLFVLHIMNTHPKKDISIHKKENILYKIKYDIFMEKMNGVLDVYCERVKIEHEFLKEILLFLGEYKHSDIYSCSCVKLYYDLKEAIIGDDNA